ncbi:MAG: ribosome-associated translation inhibitor RaiA [Sedimentisphaerales bacterium]|nr:ribosome-associated translation inhibitor RaiA [Sedimentisphaerales bacterium]
MLITISGKHIDVTEAMKSHAEEKASKLPRYYDSISQIEVVIDGGKGGSVSVEVIARAEHSKVFVCSEIGEDAYGCIDVAVHKLERQLRRAKSKERDNKRAGSGSAGEMT